MLNMKGEDYFTLMQEKADQNIKEESWQSEVSLVNAGE